jgi:hypothetical protein
VRPTFDSDRDRVKSRVMFKVRHEVRRRIQDHVGVRTLWCVEKFLRNNPVMIRFADTVNLVDHEVWERTADDEKYETRGEKRRR